MFRVRVFAVHMGGFSGPKFVNQGSLFGRFCLDMGGFSRNWQKLSKMGFFLPQFIIKSGYDGKCR